MVVDRVRIDRCTTRVGAAPIKPRAHTTGNIANGRGVPGAYDHSLRWPAELVESTSLGEQSNLDVRIDAIPRGHLSRHLRETNRTAKRDVARFASYGSSLLIAEFANKTGRSPSDTRAADDTRHPVMSIHSEQRCDSERGKRNECAQG